MSVVPRLAPGHAGERLVRELAVGSRCLDLCAAYKGARLAIEVKTWRDTDRSRDPPDEGLDQLDVYLVGMHAAHTGLPRFDQRKESAPSPVRLRVDAVITPQVH